MGTILYPHSSIRSIFQTRNHQLLATFSAALGSFSLGTVLGWTSPALPNLKTSQDLGELSADEITWIASLAILGALISGPPAGYLVNAIGRRLTMTYISVPFAVGWALIYFSTNSKTTIYLGRFLTGFCGGTFTVTVPIYVSEISEESTRGILGSVMVLMLVSGILFTFVLGAFLSWSLLSLVCGLCPITVIVAMYFMPESPKYLLKKGNIVAAEKSFRWLRNPSDWTAIENDYQDIKRNAERSEETHGDWKTLTTSPVLKPTAICIALMFFQQLGGINSVTMYTVEIFHSTGPHIDPNVASIVIGVVQVVFVTISMLLVDKVGRKALLVGSCLVMSLSLFLLGLFFRLKEDNCGSDTDSSSIVTWIPMLTLNSYIVAYSFGMGPVPWLLVSELLNPDFKEQASALVTFTYWTLAFIATKTYKDMIAVLNESGCYWVYSLICLSGGIFVLTIVPETKGKSIDEIKHYFEDKQLPIAISPRGTDEIKLEYEDHEATELFFRNRIS